MKRFSFPIILGLSLGLILIGYFVFAVYTAPTQTPPGGNVPAPLNVGPDIQTKQGKLIISGGVDSPKVGTPQLCIGPVGAQACKSTWPKELLSTDVVAVQSISHRSWSTGCAQQYSDGCFAFYLHYYPANESYQDFDPRGVLTPLYSPALMPCYERDPRRSFGGTCGPKRTYPGFDGFSCSDGFTADSGHPIANVWDGTCETSTRSSCSTAVCRVP